MRLYAPVGWELLAALQADGSLPGPRTVVGVDPQWRSGAPEVDEEEWEFEAQQLAAAALAELGGGVVLAFDAEPDQPQDDGWSTLAGPLRRRDLTAVFTADLAWHAVQEIPYLAPDPGDGTGTGAASGAGLVDS